MLFHKTKPIRNKNKLHFFTKILRRKLFSGFLVQSSFIHTFFSNGCSNIQIRGLVFDVLRQSENVL